MGREGRIGERMRPAVHRVLVVIVVTIVTAGLVWALVSPATRIPQHIAREAAPQAAWDLVGGADPVDRTGVRGVPVVGSLIDPGRGEWVWHVAGGTEDVRQAVVAWLLQDPGPDPTTAAGVVEVAPVTGLEGRTWHGQVTVNGTTTLTGVSGSAFRSVAVTVVIQPVMLLEEFTEITVRVE